MKALIMEDDPKNRVLLRSLLEARGYEVTFVNSAVVAKQHGDRSPALVDMVEQELAQAPSDSSDLVDPKRPPTLSRVSQQRYQRLFDAAPDAYLLMRHDATGNVLDANTAMASLLDCERQDLIGSTLTQIGILPDHRASASLFELLRETGHYQSGAITLTTKTHRTIEVELAARAYACDDGEFVHVTVRDVTERMRRERTLRQRVAMEHFVSSLSTRLVSAGSAELDGAIADALKQLAAFAGAERSALYRLSKRGDQLRCTHEWHSAEVLVTAPGHTISLADIAWLTARLHAGRISYVRLRTELPSDAPGELALVEKLGIESFLCLPLIYAGTLLGTVTIASAREGSVMDNEDMGLLGAIADVFATALARRQSERTLERTNRALRVISSCNQAVIHASDESQLLAEICKVVVEVGGYRSAAAYLTDGLQTEPICVASGGETTPDDSTRTLTFELTNASHSLGALHINTKRSEEIGEAELQLLRELAAYVSYGLVAIRTRAERDRIAGERHGFELQLRSSLEETIQAIAAMLETRDPYTAGHQRRVAILCTAIARKLGLSEERTHGLRLAATIHDVGKIRIPSDILNRPGRLSPVEFELVKNHAQTGHDIIKDVKLPWNIADMIWQHHEHIDGSGYPQGLNGSDIAFESRILTVADVAEAMASHRPYRPALGVAAAIAELRAHRGTFYDPDAVDACVEVLQDYGAHGDSAFQALESADSIDPAWHHMSRGSSPQPD